jgi:hypothetical protein
MSYFFLPWGNAAGKPLPSATAQDARTCLRRQCGIGVDDRRSRKGETAYQSLQHGQSMPQLFAEYPVVGVADLDEQTAAFRLQQFAQNR